jgi:hypothetical protein
MPQEPKTPSTDDVFERRMALHEAITEKIVEASSENGADVEDVFAALASVTLAILSQAEQPQMAYAKFLQDVAVMWQEGRKKMLAAQIVKR